MFFFCFPPDEAKVPIGSLFAVSGTPKILPLFSCRTPEATPEDCPERPPVQNFGHEGAVLNAHARCSETLKTPAKCYNFLLIHTSPSLHGSSSEARPGVLFSSGFPYHSTTGYH